MNIRPAIVIIDEDTSITLLKPFSQENSNNLIAIHESAYGDFEGVLTPIKELRTKLNITDEEFDEILLKLHAN